MDLFNAPPRADLTSLQKVGRIFLVTGTLVFISILSAMVAALLLFMSHLLTKAVDRHPDLWNSVSIIFLGALVNSVCVYLLFQIRRLDRKLMLRSGETPARP